MTAFNYEQDVCNGRGFVTDSPDGFLKNFRDWVVRTPVASPVSKSTGGPGWHIIDDQSVVSGGGANKYGFLESHSQGFGSSFDTIAEAQAVTDGQFNITIDGVSNDIDGLNFSSDTTYAQMASRIQTAIRAASAGANDGYEDCIVQHIRHLAGSVVGGVGGEHDSDNVNAFIIVPGEVNMDIGYLAASSGGGTNIHGDAYLAMSTPTYGQKNNVTDDPFIVVCDNASPTTYSSHKFVEIGMDTTASGYIYIKIWMFWDTTLHRGFGLYGYYIISTYDDADFVYDFRGGPECLIIQSRLGTSWDSFVIDEWTDNANLVEGSTKTGNIAAAVAAGATSFNVGGGEGVNFTAGKWYWLIDLDSAEAVEYVKVTNVATDTITIETALIKSFASGALLSAYYQRFYTCGDSRTSSNFPLSTLPLRSETNKEFAISSVYNFNYSRSGGDVVEQALVNINPDDEDFSAVMRPLIGEHDNGTYYEGNRFYGTAKNMYYTGLGTMAQMLNGRTISSAEWVYFQVSNSIDHYGISTIAAMIPNYNST